MIVPADTLLLLIDIQGKLAQSVYHPEMVERNIQKLIRACRILDVPVLYTEQYPKGLGTTIASLKELLGDLQPVEKLAFSCCAEELFMKHLRSFNRTDILVAGMETHVCVYQTSVELLEFGYNVHLVTDAVSSRTAENREIGIRCIEKAGGNPTSTEMAIFELLRIAEGDRFKAISKIIKE
ncbi:MAG: hydrolase [Chlorobium sp.]|uniref:hydrolase n=1 Tax=Chlorobium sp. TaxID=1095 RepID=UPI0025BE7923|nr:hydrolase [Chlorobium sp.]MCF8216745.1 hydrolase [Chlorobium sp.]MCF8271613.1 hydrolase [Chlorobium sp.]MCF8287985.1 hydrolase [Chlorobium sp.]MCF8291530.1 hydrolase [Chlorobium sp.]MCF8385664.1 hydrolase [Chlorobium sp.]